MFAGTHVDRLTGQPVNNFLNSHTLIQTATDASFFAVMAVGATMVIISGGIDLSVGSVYALAGVTTAMVLRAVGPPGPPTTVALGLAVSLGVGLAVRRAQRAAWSSACSVHPFIITLGTMWILRGIAFVASSAESILLPAPLTQRGQGLARPRLVAVPRADADDGGRHRARRRVSEPDGHGPAHLRRRRQPEASRFSGLSTLAHPEQRVRDSPA